MKTKITFLFLVILLQTSNAFAFRIPFIIIGDDTRQKVATTPMEDPSVYESIGQITINKGDLGWFSCTATVIGQFHILTAAHCVLDLQGREAVQVRFYPARGLDVNIPSSKRVINSKKIYYHPYYRFSRTPQFDIAVVELEKELPVRALPLGRTPVWKTSRLLRRPLITWPFAWPVSDVKVKIAGYPGDKARGQMWEGTGRLAFRDPIRPNRYDVDTYPGQSGSAIRVRRRGQDVIIGVHSSGHNLPNDPHNLGAMLDDQKIKLIQEWISKKE